MSQPCASNRTNGKHMQWIELTIASAIWLCDIRHMAPAFSLDEFAAAPLLERAHAVSAGLPAKAVRDLVADPAITLADVARLVGPRRTTDRRPQEHKPLPPDPSPPFARSVQVRAHGHARCVHRAA